MSTPIYPEYEGLRAMAEESVRRDGRFIDPVKRRMYALLPGGYDWRVSVLGHDRSVGLVDMHMLLLAHGQDVEPPMPAWLAELRAKARESVRRQRAEFAARLRALDEAWELIWRKLPVRVGVAYNYSGPNHYESYQQGAVHILLINQGVQVGRAVRSQGGAMCTTRSTARHQVWADMGDPPDKRVPTCKACIRFAARVAGVEVPQVLLDQQ